MNHEDKFKYDEISRCLKQFKKDDLVVIIKEAQTVDWSAKENAFKNLLALFKKDEKDLYVLTILGFFYLDGIGIKKDKKRAKEYFELGCLHTLSLAQYALGVMHIATDGVEKDLKRGIELLELAEKQGLVLARACLGLYFIDGDHGLEKNLDYGLKLVNSVINQGSSISSLIQMYLGYRYIEGKNVPKDIQKGMALLNLAAEQGNIMARSIIAARLLRNDDGIELNIKKGMEILTSLAEEGEMHSQHSLGMIYLYGWESYEILPNAELGIKWLICAGKQSYVISLLALGDYYRDLLNESEAIKWYGLGAKTNNDQGTLENLLGYHKNPSDAAKDALCDLYRQFEQDAKNGNPIAQCNLAFFLQHGIGTKKNMKRAVRLFQLAADQEIHFAEFALASFYKKGCQEINLHCSPIKALEYYKKAGGGDDAEYESDDELYMIKARDEAWRISETLKDVRVEIDAALDNHSEHFLHDLRALIVEYAFDAELFKTKWQNASQEIQSCCFFSYDPTIRSEIETQAKKPSAVESPLSIMDKAGLGKLVIEYAKMTEIEENEEKESVAPS